MTKDQALWLVIFVGIIAACYVINLLLGLGRR